MIFKWSGQRDSNSRPSGPKPDALPDCAMPRHLEEQTSSKKNEMIRTRLYRVNTCFIFFAVNGAT
jgi:hypothetical protein